MYPIFYNMTHADYSRHGSVWRLVRKCGTSWPKSAIQARIRRAELGNFGDCEPLGEGVSEMRIHYGRLSRLFRAARRGDCDSAGWWRQINPVEGHQDRAWSGTTTVGDSRTLKLRKWDTVEHLKTDVNMVMYLEACMEEAGDDAAFIAAALGTLPAPRGWRNSRKPALGVKASTRRYQAKGNQALAVFSWTLF